MLNNFPQRFKISPGDYWRVRPGESSVLLFSLLAFSPPSCLGKQEMILPHGLLLHARMISFHLFLAFLANYLPVILRWRILWFPNRVSAPLGTRRLMHIKVRYQKVQNPGGKCLQQLWVRGPLPLCKESGWCFWWWPLLSFVQLLSPLDATILELKLIKVESWSWFLRQPSLGVCMLNIVQYSSAVRTVLPSGHTEALLSGFLSQYTNSINEVIFVCLCLFRFMWPLKSLPSCTPYFAQLLSFS